MDYYTIKFTRNDIRHFWWLIQHEDGSIKLLAGSTDGHSWITFTSKHNPASVSQWNETREAISSEPGQHQIFAPQRGAIIVIEIHPLSKEESAMIPFEGTRKHGFLT